MYDSTNFCSNFIWFFCKTRQYIIFFWIFYLILCFSLPRLCIVCTCFFCEFCSYGSYSFAWKLRDGQADWVLEPKWRSRLPWDEDGEKILTSHGTFHRHLSSTTPTWSWFSCGIKPVNILILLKENVDRSTCPPMLEAQLNCFQCFA